MKTNKTVWMVLIFFILILFAMMVSRHTNINNKTIVPQELSKNINNISSSQKLRLENTEENFYCTYIPLTEEEQNALWSACNEFNVPIEMVLGVIEQETNFQNVIGDNGHSLGYMQIQLKWHSQRMVDIGVSDLTIPKDNFRTGCSLLSYLFEIYGDWENALTAYNTGSGGTSNYATSVMSKMAAWQQALEEYGE